MLFFIIIILLFIVIVFFWLWVIKIKVIFNFFCIFLSLYCMFWCSFKLSVVSGLLSRSIWGLLISVLVSVICCCCLLFIWVIFLFLKLFNLIKVRVFLIVFLMFVWIKFDCFFFDKDELMLKNFNKYFVFLFFNLKVMLLNIFKCGNNVYFWNIVFIGLV